MTPLLRTKTPSAPVGDKSGGERRAARAAAIAWCAAQASANSEVFTKHETRITAFMLPYPPFPTISRHFPALFGPPTPQPIKGPPAVHRSGWAAGRAPFVGNPTKMHKIPDPTGKCAKHSVGLRVSPRGEAKWVRGPSGLGASRAEEKGASRLARAGVLDPYVEHGKQAQRSPGGLIVCFDRRVVRNAG